MATRQDLHDKLIEILGPKVKVYHQPPATVRMSYPCVRYVLSTQSVKYANDKKYFKKNGYTLTVIDTNPDSEIPAIIEQMPYCEFSRFYSKDGLNHWVYEIFY